MGQAENQALKKTMTAQITDDEAASIPIPTQGKMGAALVLLAPRGEGTGVKAGGATRTILEMSGYRNVMGKQHGTNNKYSNALATLNALKNIPNRARVEDDLPGEEVNAKFQKAR